MSVATASHGATHKGLALLVLGISQLMIILDGTIVNVALVHIAQALGVMTPGAGGEDVIDYPRIQWIVTAYALTFGGVLLLGGKLADRLGRRRVFMAGLIVFGGASALGGVANSLELLIVARALQGVGGAMLAPAALSLLTVIFDEGKERDRAFGVWAAISAGGAAVGLILGGVLTQYVGWRWVFYVNVPIALFALWGTLRFVPESRDEKARGFDVIGAVLITMGLAVLVYGLSNVINDATVASGTKVLWVGGGAVLIAAFFIWEGMNREPLLPLRLFRFRNLTAANIGGLLVGAGMFPSFFYLGLWMQEIKDWSPLTSGFAFLPFTLGIIIGAGISSTMISKVGPRFFVTVGPLVAGTGLLIYGLFLAPDTSYWAVILPAQLVMSFGMGLTFPALVSGAVSGVPQENSGVASALLNSAQQVGGAVGVAILTAVSTSILNSRIAELFAGAPAPIDPAAAAAAGGAMDPATAAAQAALQAGAVVDGWATALLVGAGLMYLAGIAMGLIIRAGKGSGAPAAAMMH